MAIEMQPLTGVSEKQIKYGEDERARWVASFEASLKRATPEQAGQARKAFAAALATQTTAKWWIETATPLKALNAVFVQALKDMGAI